MTLPKGYGPEGKKHQQQQEVKSEVQQHDQTKTDQQQQVKSEVPKDLRFEVRREQFTLSDNECYIDHLVWVSPDGEEQKLASTSLRMSKTS
jgi:hypothetical protein